MGLPLLSNDGQPYIFESPRTIHRPQDLAGGGIVHCRSGHRVRRLLGVARIRSHMTDPDAMVIRNAHVNVAKNAVCVEGHNLPHNLALAVL